MNVMKSAATALLLGLLAGPASAVDYSDPTWPCVQRKVETLSLGLMWPHEIVPEVADQAPELGRDAADLAELLALRRVTLDDLRDDVASFAETYGHDSASLGLVFQDVFNRLSKRRTRIIGGIGDFSLSQIALAERIDANRMAFDAAMDVAEPDYDRIDSLEEQIDWDQLIYTDRQRSITYLCETPQLLEKRIFAIAQLLSEYVE